MLTPLKYLVSDRITNGVGLPAEHENPEWPRYIRTTDIAGPRRLRDDVWYSQPPDLLNSASVQQNDLLLTNAGMTVGKSYLRFSDEPAVYAGYLTRIRPDTRKADPRYLSYFTQSQPYWDQINVGATRSTIDNFSSGKYQDLKIPLPPLDQQRRIADMLDEETARIDALIGKKRQASSAARRRFERRHWDLVTGTDIRQLRPMSSASWVPGLPAGWSAPALRYLISWKYGHPFRSDGFTEESAATPVVRIRDLVRNRVQTWTDEWPDPSSWIDDGEIVIGMDGDFNVVRWGGGQAALNQRVCAVESQHPGLSNDYLAEAIKYPLHYINETVHFTTVRHLSFADLLAQRIPLPPSEEQHRIAKEIGQERMTLLRLQDVTERSISLLQSRRQALITAAVTGEIEV